jgi:serine/threonine protein kinase
LNDQQPDPNNANIFEQINSICKEFRRALRNEENPRIEKWLERVENAAKMTLFSNLLEIEIRAREKQGQKPSSAEYIRRFPNYVSQIRQAFDESTMGSMDHGITNGDDVSSSDPAITRTHDFAATNRLGDYELIRKLGRGGMGIVYEARHTATGNRVALKTLPTGGYGQEINADKLYRFRKEFRCLSEINHPNLVGMQTLEVDGDQWFFTMDVIDGTDFLSYVRPGDQLDEGRLRNALEQLARGVLALHQRGIIHRDLKPSNVLVAEDGTVSILDFGLASEMQRATDMTQTRSGMFAGTPRYAAPEQMFGERTEASDWYALGTMLYEALTGTPPFTGPGQVELLRQKQQEDPPLLGGRHDLPPDLTQLADGLILREPAHRMSFEAIAELLDLESESRTLEASATAGSAAFSGSQLARDSQVSEMDQADLDRLAAEEQELILVGREQQLSELEQQLEEFLRSGQPRAVWIRGRSGEGKSSLAEAFLQPLRAEQRAVVFSGRCYERESIPFKALDCWIDSLVSYLRRQPEVWLKQVLPEDITGLSQIFPMLNRVETIRRMPSIESPLMTAEKLRHRAFWALRDLLLAICHEQPVILFIDDLQWGDADSLSAFEQIFNPEEPPALLFLGSYRSDEREASQFLNGWDAVSAAIPDTTIDVAPLSKADARSLIVRLEPAAASVVDKDLDRVYAESDGNPYFLWQMIEGFDRDQNCFQPVPLQEMINRRLERLPPEARPLLEFLAVAGHDLATTEVEDLSALNKKPYTALARMRNENLVRLWGSGDGQRVDVFHDKIREIVLQHLEESVLRKWHRRIGEALERRSGTVGKSCLDYPPEDPFDRVPQDPIPDLFDMARHFDAAGDRRRWDYQLLAGEQALRQNSNREAIDYFENARRQFAKSTPTSLKVRVLYGLGEALSRCQNQEAAVEAQRCALNWRQMRKIGFGSVTRWATCTTVRARFVERNPSIWRYSGFWDGRNPIPDGA